MISLGIVAYPGCMASGLLAFAELITAANQRSAEKKFDLRWVGLEKQNLNLSLSAGALPVSICIDEYLWHDSLDIILLPGFWGKAGLSIEAMLDKHQPLVDGLKKVQPEKTVLAYCTAVALLARSGRLVGQQATGTWWLSSHLQQNYTDVDWHFSQTSVVGQQQATASGVNGYLPFAQALIEQHCGSDVWRDLTDLMVIAKPDKNVQPFNHIHLMNLNDKQMAKIYLWVENTAATDLTLNNLAASFNQSPRTLSRKVKVTSDLSCVQFMRLVKLRQAGERLMYGEQSIHLISDELGYSDDAAFRRSFKKETGHTPGEFRQVFKR